MVCEFPLWGGRRAECLVAPKIGAVPRIRGKWEKCSEYAPIFQFLLKHKGYYLTKKSGHNYLLDKNEAGTASGYFFAPKCSDFCQKLSRFCPDFMTFSAAQIFICPH